MASGFVPALVKTEKVMNIFKTLLKIKDHSALREALEDLANGFEYDRQYQAHNRYIDSEPVRQSTGPIFFGPPQDFNPINPNFSSPSLSDNSNDFGGFGGGDFGGSGTGGEF